MSQNGMGVVCYDTLEGGSGYIANSALPWLSEFNITMQAPVYDQETAWLRTSRPGTYTNYYRFGPPYSMDGGIQPPYRGGMGAVEEILLRSDVVAPMPSITTTARSGCVAVAEPSAGDSFAAGLTDGISQIADAVSGVAAAASNDTGVVPVEEPYPWWLLLVGVIVGAALFSDSQRSRR